MKGTLLNTATVAVGGLLGLAIGHAIPDSYQDFVLAGLGLVTLGMGLRMFMSSQNVLVVAIGIALGGLMGMALGIQTGVETLGRWVQSTLGGGDRFAEGLITTSILFCVGPMALLGAIQDGLEGRSELLELKSVMDGACAVFFAAAMGLGVVFSALVILIYQGAVTLLAKRLKSFARDEAMVADATGAGGLVLASIGLSLLDIKSLPNANFIPAIVVAPLAESVFRRFRRPTE